MISSTDLKYFMEVAQTLHVSRAAERLGISQPALSHCLKRIEEDIGHPIFIRTKQGVILTSSGEKLLEKAHELSVHWENLLSGIKEDIEEVSGLIKLGCHPSVAQFTLPRVLPNFLETYPKIEIHLTHGLSRHVTEQVISSKIDVALAVNPVSHPDLIIKEVLRDQVTLWKSSRLANPEVLLIEPNLLQTQNLLMKLGKQGIHFKRTIESSSLEVLAQLMMAGAGIAILPEKVIRVQTDDRIQRLKNAPVFEDRICLVFRREFIKTQRGKIFVETVKRTFR